MNMNDNITTTCELTDTDCVALHRILDASAIVSMADVRGDIVYVNDKFVELSQYSRDELLGQNHRIVKWGDEFREVYADLWKTISGGKTWRGEIKNRAKDGSFYWVDAIISPMFNSAGAIEKYIALRLLITDKKRGEEELGKRLQDAETTSKIMIDRELRMVELKKQVAELQQALKECQKDK